MNVASSFWDVIKSEPVRLVAAVQTTLAALVLFGLDLSPEQLAGVVVAISAWLALVTRNDVVWKQTAEMYVGHTQEEWEQIGELVRLEGDAP